MRIVNVTEAKLKYETSRNAIRGNGCASRNKAGEAADGGTIARRVCIRIESDDEDSVRVEAPMHVNHQNG